MEAKTLEKMTVPKLREEALKFGDITGVHGMRKAELIAALKEKFAIVEEKAESETLAERKHGIKKKIRQLKAKKEQAEADQDKKNAALLRKRLRRQRRVLKKAIKKAQAESA